MAQPSGPARPAPAPTPAPAAGEDGNAFEKDLDTLFAPGGLTADQAAARAAKVAPSVRRKAAEVEASIAQLQVAELAQVPQLKGTASYTRLSHLPPLVFGGMPLFSFPQNSYATQAQLGIPLSEYLVRFPKVIDAAKLGVEAARTGQRSSEVNAGQEARLAYYEWLRARLQVLVAERQQVQIQAVLKQVRALADAQRLSKADLMRVESQEAQAEQVVNQLRNLAVLREEQLRLLIGAGEEPLALGEDPRTEVNAPAPGSLDDLVKTATLQRLEFKAIDAGIQAKEKQRESEKANMFPHLSAFATADYANPNQRVFPLEDKWKFTWQAGVQLSWTINDALVARATDRRIAAETNELREDRENLARGTRIEVLAAQQAVQLALISQQTTQKGLAAAEEGYRVRRELLNAERATAVELVDAETDLTRARIAALNARVDLRVAMAQLAHALGNDAKTAR
ncbi:MAG TPA: TolC family protein [Kofleriaceae bacterium]|nr:TolC family protein [Kofleriaceae bacterium]